MNTEQDSLCIKVTACTRCCLQNRWQRWCVPGGSTQRDCICVDCWWEKAWTLPASRIDLHLKNTTRVTVSGVWQCTTWTYSIVYSWCAVWDHLLHWCDHFNTHRIIHTPNVWLLLKLFWPQKNKRNDSNFPFTGLSIFLGSSFSLDSAVCSVLWQNRVKLWICMFSMFSGLMPAVLPLN